MIGEHHHIKTTDYFRNLNNVSINLRRLVVVSEDSAVKISELLSLLDQEMHVGAPFVSLVLHEVADQTSEIVA